MTNFFAYLDVSLACTDNSLARFTKKIAYFDDSLACSDNSLARMYFSLTRCTKKIAYFDDSFACSDNSLARMYFSLTRYFFLQGLVASTPKKEFCISRRFSAVFFIY